MDFLIKAAQLILSLSILVVLHEFGHFIPARLFKTRVEKFYLFFNPWFSLFKKKVGETEWGIGWLPLGGYVKMLGEHYVNMWFGKTTQVLISLLVIAICISGSIFYSIFIQKKALKVTSDDSQS